MNEYETLMECYWQGHLKYIEKTYPIATMSTYITCTGQGLNPGLYGEILMTNCLSTGMVIDGVKCRSIATSAIQNTQLKQQT